VVLSDQGDVVNARRLVEEVLAMDPLDGEARVLLERIGKTVDPSFMRIIPTGRCQERNILCATEVTEDTEES